MPVLARADGLRLTVGTRQREDGAAAGAGTEGRRFGEQRIGCPPPLADLVEQGRAWAGLQACHWSLLGARADDDRKTLARGLGQRIGWRQHALAARYGIGE